MSQRSEFEILRDLDQALNKLPDDKDPNELIKKAKEEEALDRVVNVKQTEAYDVYIARENKRYGLSESKWANPYKKGTQEEMIQKYEDYIRNKPELLEALPELKGKVLGCWCRPKACHGDVLIKLLQEKGIEQGGRRMATKQKVKEGENRTQVGSWIDRELWKQIRAQAALESRSAGYVLDDAIRLYIRTQKENQGKQLY